MSIEVAGKQIKELRIGVNGQPRTVTEGWVGVNGAPRRFYSASVPLSSFEIGSLVYIKEDGVPAPYIVSGHEYDIRALSSESVVRSVLVRQEITGYYKPLQVSSASQSYEESLDPAVIEAAKVPILIIVGQQPYAVSFALLMVQLGLSLSGYDTSKLQELPNASTLKMCDQWLGDMRRARSVGNSTSYRAYTNQFGVPSEAVVSNALNSVSHGFRPVLYLPGETMFNKGSGEFVG